MTLISAKKTLTIVHGFWPENEKFDLLSKRTTKYDDLIPEQS